uniref:Protein kinase domain-containing protein n=1 Tax=Mesocestoides corti TaxID=53468 RepID=A0A5K3EQA2_MESCO
MNSKNTVERLRSKLCTGTNVLRTVSSLIEDCNHVLFQIFDQKVANKVIEKSAQKCPLEKQFEDHLKIIYSRKDIIASNRALRDQQIQLAKEAALNLALQQEREMIRREQLRKKNRRQEISDKIATEKNRIIIEQKLKLCQDIYSSETIDMVDLSLLLAFFKRHAAK